MRRLVLCLIVLVIRAGVAAGQEATTVLPRPDEADWWLSGQANVIYQRHGRFTSPYQGDHSLQPQPEEALSRVLTLYTGVRLPEGTELLLDVESAAGHGISEAFGLAGFTNLDVVRNPTLGAAPYVARAMVHHVFALSADTVESVRGPFSLARRLPRRRLEVRAGKFGTADWFDLNGGGSDSHFQFLNWTVDNNGAYDYAADTRGYTVGVEAEYQDSTWGLRFQEALMPKVANGIDLDWHLGRAHAENVELELRRSLLPGRTGVLRLLGYVNHANMGSYADANASARAHATVPAIESTRQPGRTKAGLGLNAEQQLSETARLFARAGWNDGRTESFAYTEVDRTAEIGGDIAGASWHRPTDRAGAALVANGLSADHREYLALGGLGFLLGDGRIAYGAEAIVEAYYTAHLWSGLFAAFDLQRIWNPGYNRDRGPVFVPAIRVHIEF